MIRKYCTMLRSVTLLAFLIYVSDLSIALYIPESESRQMIIDAHNALRRKVATRWADRGLGASDMRKMSWDSDLAAEAAASATCDSLDESSAAGSSFLGGGGSSVMFFEDLETLEHGKNVAVTSHGNIRQMISQWSAQGSQFNFKHRMCVSGHDCQAFKQMIFARASRLGCSLNPYCEVEGERVKLLVCMYDEKVNIIFDVYTMGPVCSSCNVPAGFCEDALCVSSCHGSASSNCGCLKTCKHPGVGEGVLHPETCLCSCVYGLGPDCHEICANPQPYIDYDFCAEMNTPESCELERVFQEESCPANCDYGCRPAP